MRRHQRVKNQATAQPVPVAEPEAPPGVPVTPESAKTHWRLQQLKISLCRRLRELQRAPVIVQTSIDEQGCWFFLIRGSLPRFESWHGVPCRYIREVREVLLPAHQG